MLAKNRMSHPNVRIVFSDYLLKPEIGWDWPGSAGTRSRVLAFGTIGSWVPGFDVIAITDIIGFLPLAINDSDAMYIAIHRRLQSIYQL